VDVLLLYRRRHCYLPKQYDNLSVGSERNHKNRKTDNQKALKEPGLYKQIWLPGLDNVDNKEISSNSLLSSSSLFVKG